MTKKTLAQIISQVFSPVFLSIFIIIMVLARFSIKASLSTLSLFLIILIYFGLPFIFFLFSLFAGQISDWDMGERRQRYRFYLFSLGCWFLGLIYINSLGQIFLFKIFLTFSLLGLSFTLINFWQKISSHVGVATVFFLLTNLLSTKNYFWLVFLIPLVAWSRLYLKKHSPFQVLLGAVIPLILLPLLIILLDLKPF